MTTEELIARLTELEAKATPGPWVTAADAGCTNPLYKGLIADLGNDLTNKWRAVVKDGDYLVANDEMATNADLIVALCNDALPALKALAAENVELRKAIEHGCDLTRDGTQV